MHLRKVFFLMAIFLGVIIRIFLIVQKESKLTDVSLYSNQYSLNDILFCEQKNFF